MILGILSDTHGQRLRVAAAIRLLKQLGTQVFVHCGDIGGAGVLSEFAGLDAVLVMGNTDYPDASLERYAASIGLKLNAAPPLRLQYDRRSIAVFHGHEPQFYALANSLIETGHLPPEADNWDYILHGHTHIASDQRVGRTRLINPGALHRARVCTVATLDTADDDLKFWRVFDDVADNQDDVPLLRYYPGVD